MTTKQLKNFTTTETACSRPLSFVRSSIRSPNVHAYVQHVDVYVVQYKSVNAAK